jgi:hypothetical protein
MTDMRKILFLLALVLCHPADAATWYVSGTSGSDTLYDGTAATVSGGHGPFATLGKAETSLSAGDTVVILDQTVYRGDFQPFNDAGGAGVPCTLQGKTLGPALSTQNGGAMAILSGGAIAPASWTNWTAEGASNVWYQPYALSISSSAQVAMVSENGELLYAVIQDAAYTAGSTGTGVAAVSAKPGSYYHDSTNNVLYIQASDSSNPNTNGKTYEWSSPTVNRPFEGYNISDVHCRNCWADDVARVWGTAARCVFEQGPDHLVFCPGSSSFVDCFFLNGIGTWSTANTNGQCNAVVVYNTNISTYTLSLLRCMIDSRLGATPATAPLNCSGLYSHGSPNTTALVSITCDQCVFRNLYTVCDAATNSASFTNSYYANYGQGFTVGLATTPGTYTQTRVLGTHYVNLPSLMDAGTPGGGTWATKDSAFYCKAGTNTLFQMRYPATYNWQTSAVWRDSYGGYLLNFTGVTPGTITLQNCVLGTGNTSCTLASFPASGSTITSDYNVWCLGSNTSASFVFSGGTGYNTLAGWYGATGLDAHSVYAQSTDQTAGTLGSPSHAFWYGVAYGIDAGPSAGDWRINPAAYVYDVTNTRRTGLFGDGTTAITTAGPQTRWDWGLHSVQSGPPSVWPDAFIPANRYQVMSYLFKASPQAPIAIHK